MKFLQTYLAPKSAPTATSGMVSPSPSSHTLSPRAGRLAIAAAISAFLAPLTAQAVDTPVIQAVQGDVVIAFRDTTNSALGSYLVNIGPVAQFTGASAGSTTPLALVGALGGDLDTYDAFEVDTLKPWHTRLTVVWSAFSRNSTDNEAIFISRPRTSLAVQSNPYGARYGTQHNSAYGEISSTIGQGYNVLISTSGVANSANNPRGGFQATTTGATSYWAQVSTEGRGDFGLWQDIEKNFGAGAAASPLDFYVFRKGAAISDLGTVQYIGYFTITQAGVVSFTRAGTVPGTGDADGDGVSDNDEALAGTDPQNPASFFKLPTPAVVKGVSTTIGFPTIASRKYTIQYSETLAGTWQEVHVHLSGAGATPLQFIDTDPVRIARAKGFYRATVTTP